MQIYPEKRKDYVGDYTPVRRNPKKWLVKTHYKKVTEYMIIRGVLVKGEKIVFSK